MSWGRRREQTGRGMFYSIKICDTALKLIRRCPGAPLIVQVRCR